ncbi:hypothetical protein P7L53_15930 [Thermoleptolyngbya sichuanensis XZ-Cy5]|nr:hypothetical protein [Thermoleptolyngbya sichuanensis XZ-Cy5]
MNEQQLEHLVITQQVLRSVVIALGGASKVDMATLASLLTSAACQPNLHPMAQQMLADLATGTSMLGKAGLRPQ